MAFTSPDFCGTMRKKREASAMENENKASRYARIHVWLTGAILVVLCVVAILVVPRTLHVLAQAEETLGQIGELSRSVGATMETADSALAAANAAANTANQIRGQCRRGRRGAAEVQFRRLWRAQQGNQRPRRYRRALGAGIKLLQPIRKPEPCSGFLISFCAYRNISERSGSFQHFVADLCAEPASASGTVPLPFVCAPSHASA